MNRTFPGFEKMTIAEIGNGDIVMFFPEDQFEYRAERQRDGSLELHPDEHGKAHRCSVVRYLNSSGTRLWVKQ